MTAKSYMHVWMDTYMYMQPCIHTSHGEKSTPLVLYLGEVLYTGSATCGTSDIRRVIQINEGMIPYPL